MASEEAPFLLPAEKQAGDDEVYQTPIPRGNTERVPHGPRPYRYILASY